MDHADLLTLFIHLAEIPTSPQNFANTSSYSSSIILWYDLGMWCITLCVTLHILCILKKEIILKILFPAPRHLCPGSRGVQSTDGFGNLWKSFCLLEIPLFRYFGLTGPSGLILKLVKSELFYIFFRLPNKNPPLSSGWTRQMEVSFSGTRTVWPPSGNATRSCTKWKHRCCCWWFVKCDALFIQVWRQMRYYFGWMEENKIVRPVPDSTDRSRPRPCNETIHDLWCWHHRP